MREVILSILLFAVLAPALFASDNAGSATYQFLKFDPSARSSAMGSAFSGLADDASAVFSNPGGCAFIKGKQIMGNFGYYFAGITGGNIAFTTPVAKNQTIISGVNFVSYGKLDETDETGEVIGTFSPFDIAVGIGYSRKLGRKLAIGGTGKFILSSIKNYTSYGFAGDFGALIRIGTRTRAGIAVLNAGFQSKGYTSGHKDPLPLTFRIGASHRLKGLPAIFTGELLKEYDDDIRFRLGAETTSLKPFFVRVGYAYMEKPETDEIKDNSQGITVGIGYENKTLGINYSYSLYGVLGGVHRITLFHSLR
ncbi:PorV/PorQ family protein [bacterium]|nr:PorV/PorQ family protein [bacterium]